jgi:hypothetical protein
MAKALPKFEVYALYEDGYGYFDIRVVSNLITSKDISSVSMSPSGTKLNKSEPNPNLRRLYKKLVSENVNELVSYSFELADIFLTDIVINVHIDGDTYQADWKCEKLSLDFTYTPDINLFRKRFTFKSGRHAYRKTVKFIAENNLKRLEEISQNIAVSSFVINGYSALELNPTEEEIDEALSFSNALHSFVKAMSEPSGRVSSRDNRTSMLLSMMTVQVHCELYLGRYDNLRKLCENMLLLVKNKDFYLYHAFNTSKSFLFAAIVGKTIGDSELLALSEEGSSLVKEKTRELLRQEAEELPKEWVDEAHHAMDVISATESIFDLLPCQLDKSLLRSYLESATRVKSRDYLNMVMNQLT